MALSSSRDIINSITQCLIDFNARDDEGLEEDGIFIIKKANKSLADGQKANDPRSLWKELWYEGEICCLFSDSNLGKSIYAVQIANSIASVEKVMYFDFELSEKQFQLRYTNDVTGELFVFPSKLYRVDLNCAQLDPNTFEDIVVEEILNLALKRATKILIIDNLTYLCSTMEKAEAAGTLMQRLVSIKKQYGFSILVLAHTPKRNLWEVLNENHLAGSKRLYNMFDSCFAIGKSALGEELRYIKQLKVRWGKKTYGEGNVLVAQIEKIGSFLQFVEKGNASEYEHLKMSNEEAKEQISKTIIELKEKGKSFREIAKQLNMKKSTVSNYYQRYVGEKR